MRIFLTGSTGFIGQPLTRELLARGWEVTALVRKPESAEARALTNMGAKLVRGDVTERESMRAGMQGADIVIHNAGYYELGINRAAQKHMQAINVTGTENVLGLALELGIPHNVYVSTTQAYGDSGADLQDESFVRKSPAQTCYQRTKMEAHDIAVEYQQRGLPLVIASPNGVIGPNDHSIWGYYVRLYLNKMLPPMGPIGNCLYTLVELNDLARGLALAAEKGRPGEAYFLCGESKSTKEHIAYWYEYPGGNQIRVWLPKWLAEPMFWTLEPLQRAAGISAFLSREMVDTAAINFNYSSAKAQRELGWSYCSAEEMWRLTFKGELELAKQRRSRSIVARLKPLELEG
ncbi:MAG TPA: SDR family NAD(P)-dependent oxidoreductase [Anaerolineales bacterium]|jgi:dihydroflavonol-4-reductase